MAHDLRQRVLGLLARRPGRVPHQRRHRRRRAALPRRRRGDEDFERGPALELLVETARLWRSVGHHDAAGGFRIDGVTGPDEYTSIADNNVYTNLMAARNLRNAATLATRHPKRAAALGVDEEEVASWRDAAHAIVIPFDDELGVTQQCEQFTHYRHWDFANTPAEHYPLLLHYPYYLLYSSQVVKQADLVFALYACGDCFSDEQKARDFEYYEAITVRDSSLSACVQAIVAAEVGHVDLAYDYLGETAFIDLRDLAFNTKDGVHLAALAGSWLVAVAGFGGMRDHGDTLTFAPRLPARLTRLSFRLIYRGRRLRVTVAGREGALRAARRRAADRRAPRRAGRARGGRRAGDARAAAGARARAAGPAGGARAAAGAREALIGREVRRGLTSAAAGRSANDDL